MGVSVLGVLGWFTDALKNPERRACAHGSPCDPANTKNATCGTPPRPNLELPQRIDIPKDAGDKGPPGDKHRSKWAHAHINTQTTLLA
eukprot:3002961-Alexandrium_andersonii.AAC.1